MRFKLVLGVFLVTSVAYSFLPQVAAQTITDANTPLHALQPDYPVPYGPASEKDITEVLIRVLNYLDASTPAELINGRTKAPFASLKDITGDAVFAPGVFRLVSYEWGVTYGAMLMAGEVTGDARFTDYTIKRMNLIAGTADYFSSLNAATKGANNPVRSVLEPRSLDDAGSMCAAMIKTYEKAGNRLKPYIDNYINFISNVQLRLEDGTLARSRPLPNSLWLDDLYMSVPALARMGKLTGEKKYFDDACGQVIRFSQRMFNRNTGLFMHGWIQDMNPHPAFYWGRCNGWALLAMTELLDVLPADHPQRGEILDILRSHIAGLASYQSATGFWHQLIDRNDSYPETSATAIFTYCIAHAANNGWIDYRAYGPVAVLGWNAVQTKVNQQGQVEGTCVGTGMAFDPSFYYYRPVNIAAAHGYGPVILAGAEMIRLQRNFKVVINDSAVMLYVPGTDLNTNK